MYINLENILFSKNKTLYWLAKETGIRYQTLAELMKNRTNGIKFGTLEEICAVLDCEIEDILILEKKKGELA